MTYYGGSELAARFRTVRNNTIQIAEEIPEESYSFKPLVPDIARFVALPTAVASAGRTIGHRARSIAARSSPLRPVSRTDRTGADGLAARDSGQQAQSY